MIIPIKKRPDLNLEKRFTGVVAGLDEVGRGPWAGPVYAAAVVFTSYKLPQSLSQQIHDSKKLTEKKRLEVAAAIKSYDKCHWSVAQAEVGEIDSLNIVQATFLAMQRCISKLSIKIDVALIDGHIVPDLTCEAIPVVGGDGSSLSIAAASIIAKVARDQYMRELAISFPQYGWETNVGYGTKKHQIALNTHGVTPHHRRSFAPIRALLSDELRLQSH